MLDRMKPYRVTAGLLLAVVYLTIQALTGQLGLLAGPARAKELAAREAEAVRLDQERQELELRVERLSHDNLSRDLAEERIRVVLGYADPREVVVEVQAQGAEQPSRTARS